MTNNEQRVWKALRIIHPLFFFCIALFGLYYFLDLPLILAVVIAWVLAAANYAILTWFINKRLNSL